MHRDKKREPYDASNAEDALRVTLIIQEKERDKKIERKREIEKGKESSDAIIDLLATKKEMDRSSDIQKINAFLDRTEYKTIQGVYDLLCYRKRKYSNNSYIKTLFNQVSTLRAYAIKYYKETHETITSEEQKEVKKALDRLRIGLPKIDSAPSIDNFMEIEYYP